MKIMNSIYNINWTRFVYQFLPTILRKPTLLAFMITCIKPLSTCYLFFFVFKSDADYRVQHNGQICYLQKMLNDKFDASLRRIKVQNIRPKEPLWMYYPEDEKPLFMYEEVDFPVYFYNSEDYYNEFDFEVLIPNVLDELKNQMMANINYYKLFSKNYKITTL